MASAAGCVSNLIIDPQSNLFKLKPILVREGHPNLSVEFKTFQAHQHNWVAQLAQCDDRDVALAWRGAYFMVERSQLPVLPENEYYWTDLEGLQVVDLAGQALGTIDRIFATGANDVIVIKQGKTEHCIPYLRPDVIKEVDLTKGIMVVDWEL